MFSRIRRVRALFQPRGRVAVASRFSPPCGPGRHREETPAGGGFPDRRHAAGQPIGPVAVVDHLEEAIGLLRLDMGSGIHDGPTPFAVRGGDEPGE